MKPIHILKAGTAVLALTTATAAMADNVVFWVNAPMASGPDAPLFAEIAAFEAETGHKVEVQAVPHLEMQRNLIVAMSSGAGPDVMAVDIAWVPVIADAGLLADLSDHTAKVADLYQPGPLSAGAFQGAQYAMPWYTNNVALYVNNKMLADAGIAAAPTTWAEFEAAAIAMTDPAKDTYGLTLGGAGTGAFQVYTLIWQKGGELIDTDVKVRLNEPAAIQAIEFVSGLYTKHKAIPDSVLTASTWDEVNAPFLQSRAGMLISGDWALGAIKRNAPDLDFSVHPLPKGVQAATVIGGYNIAVNANSKAPDAALALTEWLTGPRSTDVMPKYNRIAGTKDAAAPEVVAALPETQKAFLQQAEAGKPRPVVAGWADIHTTVTGTLWDQVLRGKPVAEAMAEAATAAEAILAK
ncbi:MAG: sugar ABC transporter substrate-binding protein [Gemmobacter sp.]|nr:sugar ABC transporter substrate-binding protein [Gemmobacter sp.]